jgi:UDP-N-acetylglucosamine enolpyruvyl transferase
LNGCGGEIDRLTSEHGCEKMDAKLRKLGARIQRIEEK